MSDVSLLTGLNLKPNYIYETIVTTYNTEDKSPHAAPMGITILDEQTAIISPYLSTQTYKNIEKSRCAVINFIYDLDIFFESTFSARQPKLPLNLFEKATEVNAPQLKPAIAHIEVRVSEIQIDAERSRIEGEVVTWNLSTIPFYPLNRGYNLVLESLVHATRVIAFQDDPQKARPLMDLIKQYQNVIKKVAPTGKFVSLIAKIQNIIEKKD